MAKKTLKNILIGTAAVVITVFTALPNVTFAQEPAKGNNNSWNAQIGHYHVTLKGDTIVSCKDTIQVNEFLEKEVKQSHTTTVLPEDTLHPMYGLNGYVPAWNENYQTDTDWYGSGDVDGNGVINIADYNSGVYGANPFDDGTYRGDTDLDGVSGTENDKAIILDYIYGNRSHINRWELETEGEKLTHLENALAIDPTSEVNAGSSGWICGNYSAQTYINFNGVYDIENSGYTNGSWGNLQFDSTHNGIFRIPLRIVHTKTSNNIAHAICSVFIGGPYSQDVTDFNHREYIEPQNDQLLNVGDFSLNDYADEYWYGYYYSSPWDEWWFGSRNLIKYDLTTNPPTTLYINLNLVISWTPFDQVNLPQDQSHYYPGNTSVEANGEPTNLYEGTSISYSDNSAQTNNETCTDVDYTVTRTWELTSGAYNPNNTSNGSHEQIISVADNEAPTGGIFPTDITLDYSPSVNTNSSATGVPIGFQDNSGLEVIVSESDNSNQTSNGTCTDVSYAIERDWTVEDVCGNETSHSQYISVEDNEAPTGGTFPSDVNLDYSSNVNTEPSATGTPTGFNDNSGLGVIISYTDNSNQTGNGTCIDVSYTIQRNWIVEDQCGNEINYTQNISVTDNEPPVRDGSGNWTDNSGLEVSVTENVNSTQDPDPNNCNHYVYESTTTENAEDVCGNEASYVNPTEYFEDNEGAYVFSTSHEDGETLYRPQPDMSPNPTSGEWAEFADDQSPVTKEFETELIEEDDVHELYRVNQWGMDACQNEPQDEFEYFVHVPKPTGLGNIAMIDNAKVYPNPTLGDFNLHYNKAGNIKVGLYDVAGKLLEEKLYEGIPEDVNIPYSLKGKAKGLYIIKIQSDDGQVETEKITK